MWGLWSLMIVAPIALFIGVNYRKRLVGDAYQKASASRTKLIFRSLNSKSSVGIKNQVYVSNVMFLFDTDVNTNKPVVSTSVFIDNRTGKLLETRFELISGKSECLNGGESMAYATRKMNKGQFWIFLEKIKRWREQKILINIHWKLGTSRGIDNIVIPANKAAKLGDK